MLVRMRDADPEGRQVIVCDVGPRDGLQNEARTLSAGVRAQLCDLLAEAGVPRIEAVSFVNPKLVPQMADTEEVLATVRRRPQTVLAGLVLNDRGLERALAAGVDEVHYAFPVTETFAQRNQNTTVEGGLATGRRLVARCREHGMRVTVTLIVAVGCPFAPRATGNIPTEDLVYMLHGMGVRTGIDLQALIEASRWLGEHLGKELPAMLPKADDFGAVSGSSV